MADIWEIHVNPQQKIRFIIGELIHKVKGGRLRPELRDPRQRIY